MIEIKIISELRAGKLPWAVKKVATKEKVEPTKLRRRLLNGNAVIMVRDNFSLGIGAGLKTKINANIGTSAAFINVEMELEKARVATKYGADTISDLSMGGDIDAIRKKIFSVTHLPITTVPIYQAVAEKNFRLKEQDIIEMIKKHAEEGVSSIVVHVSITRKMLAMLKRSRRIMGIVSKGGALTSAWMLTHDTENPFLTNYDEILDILYEHDVVLSLGNPMRAGCIHDLKDTVMAEELKLNARLAELALKKGVQTIVEGMGGHVNPLDIARMVETYKRVTNNKPLFVAGPLPIDIGVGYDHIAACVGASLASGAGADYLCYITPAEHLSLPNPQHVKEGVIAFKIAAHIGDTIKYGLSVKDKYLAIARRKRDWATQFKYAFDPELCYSLHRSVRGSCTMCGKYCAYAIMERYLR